ncbi:MAG: aldo/keto reductase [Thainema sp.]
MHLTTLQGQPVSRLGLASQYIEEANCVPTAFDAGINYFFSYSTPTGIFLQELRSLVAGHREQLIVATGSEHRDTKPLQHRLDEIRQQLNTDIVDVFFLEYISPDEDINRVKTAIEQLYTWQRQGSIRYVGITTHNRSIALNFVQTQQCDVLMHRYNMAHRQVEATVLPVAQAAEIPVIAFTCTRWSTLLQGHPDWPDSPPSASDCYRYTLQQPSVHCALTSPKSLSQLQENLSVLTAPPLPPAEVKRWQQYGDLIYGSGQDSFETRWP